MKIWRLEKKLSSKFANFSHFVPMKNPLLRLKSYFSGRNQVKISLEKKRCSQA
jgi:hypothetical protein